MRTSPLLSFSVYEQDLARVIGILKENERRERKKKPRKNDSKKGTRIFDGLQ